MCWACSCILFVERARWSSAAKCSLNNFAHSIFSLLRWPSSITLICDIWTKFRLYPSDATVRVVAGPISSATSLFYLTNLVCLFPRRMWAVGWVGQVSHEVRDIRQITQCTSYSVMFFRALLAIAVFRGVTSRSVVVKIQRLLEEHTTTISSMPWWCGQQVPFKRR
jgi:hypothetical protein